MSIDVLADFFTVIRNGLAVGKRSVSLPSSNLKVQIARVLKNEGFIKDYKVDDNDRGKSELMISLKYFSGDPVIHEIQRISKPSRRYYERANNIKSVLGGLGVVILSTNKGIMTDRIARQEGVGGEVICYVW